MRRLSLLLAIVVTLVLASRSMMGIDTWEVRANEYFGDGVMLSGKWEVESGKWNAGLIVAWGWYAIYGTTDDCRIVPLWSPVGDARTVPCGMAFNEKGTMFRGWMDFRGHPRPFCGALTGKGLPEKCFGE